MYGYIILICSTAIGIICISYRDMAIPHRWPTGEILLSGTSLPQILALTTILWALGKSFFVFFWWSPIVVLALGWVLAFVITMGLKHHVQWLGVIGIYPAQLLTLLYISDSKPLGVFHNFLG